MKIDNVLTVLLIMTGIILIWLIGSSIDAWPRDPEGKYANSPLKAWFNQLGSKKGLCCSFADGVKIENVDWDAAIFDGAMHYRVRVCDHGPSGTDTWEDCKPKTWVVVPDNAVVTEPNRFGPAVVWPYINLGQAQIRCFLPGAGT
jgi:hypothetical protein